MSVLLTQKNKNNKIYESLTLSNKYKENFRVTKSEWKSKIKFSTYSE